MLNFAMVSFIPDYRDYDVYRIRRLQVVQDMGYSALRPHLFLLALVSAPKSTGHS